MEAKVIITTGVPASGKSTWAAKRKQTHVELNLDNLREELSGDATNQAVTLAAIKVRNRRLAQYIAEGKSVIISDTNAHPEFRAQLIQQVLDLGVPNHQVLILHFSIDPQEAKQRNAARVNPVPNEVIDRMHQALVEFPPEADAVHFDVDFAGIIAGSAPSVFKQFEAEWGSATAERIRHELEEDMFDVFKP